MIDISDRAGGNVWADSFGVWHASVPLSGYRQRDANNARKLIRDEINASMGEREVPTGYVIRVTREHVTNHGTAIYREV